MQKKNKPEKTRFVHGIEIRPKARKIVEVGDSFRTSELVDHIHFEEQRRFLGKNFAELEKNIRSARIGDILTFRDTRQEYGNLEKVLVMEVRKTERGVFSVLKTFNTDYFFKPRGSVTSSEAQDADFGMGFAATGGNSVPQKPIR